MYKVTVLDRANMVCEILEFKDSNFLEELANVKIDWLDTGHTVEIERMEEDDESID